MSPPRKKSGSGSRQANRNHASPAAVGDLQSLVDQVQALRRRHKAQPSAEGAAELVLGFADVGILLADRLRFFDLAFGIEEVGDVAFGGADGEMEGENLLGCGGDGFRGFEREEGSRVTEGELAGLDIELD